MTKDAVKMLAGACPVAARLADHPGCAQMKCAPRFPSHQERLTDSIIWSRFCTKLGGEETFTFLE